MIGFITKKSATGSDGKPSSGRGGDGSHSSSTKTTPKKDSQGSSVLPASQPSPCHSGRETPHRHKSHNDLKDSSGDKKKKKKDASPARKSSSHKACKDGNHKKVCIGFITKKSATGSDSKPSSGRGGDGSCSGSTKATPKKDSKAPAADSQGSSVLPASQPLPRHSG